MATKYADRMFVSVNGQQMFDVQSMQVKQNLMRKPVKSMTPNGRDRGFVEGNAEFDVSCVIANQNGLARAKLESINYNTTDVQITAVWGPNQFVVRSVFLKDCEDNAAGVGEEVKTTFNFGALDLSDPVGNSTLFQLTA